MGSPAANYGPSVYSEVKHAQSAPLRDIGVPSAFSTSTPRRVLPLRTIPIPKVAPRPDPVVQRSAGPALAPTIGVNFEGIGEGLAGFSVIGVPPDPNGAVGATQFVEIVNTSIAVFDKTGNLLMGPVLSNSLWTGFGGSCETDNDGDGIVQYDKAANRWVITQFAVTNGPPFFECFAVSTTNDATGTYNLYSFQYSDFNDYPKLGIWPDAYYISYNNFGTNTFDGANVCALDRTSMLSGAAATQVCFQQSPSVTYFTLLPSDWDGALAPPSGSPNFFLGYDQVSLTSLDLFKFHVDFTTPANSTFTGPTSITVAPYTIGCISDPALTCVPQLGTTQTLDSLADRLMNRLAYRHFADGHESLVVDHTVGTPTGVRWYEIQDPNGTPTVVQQSTFSPDSTYRWMGSIAMDQTGNIALGYSASSSTTNPGILVTGRLATDPPGVLQAEASIQSGSGSQTGQQGSTRWGDYTSMNVDPVDDCTFWYTNEYLTADGLFNWHTRIATLTFPTCTGTGTTATTTTLTASAASVAFGTIVSLTANVSSASGTPTGSATFLDGATALGTQALDNSGNTTLMTSTLAIGAHTLTASYTPTGVFLASSSAPVNLTVTQAATTTTLGSSANPVGVGQNVTFTATVAPALSGTPTGTVTFLDGTTTLGTGPLSAGAATFTTSALALGTHSITASYGGDANFLASLSSALSQVVATPDYSITPGALTPSSVTRGQSATSTITVASIAGFSSSVALTCSVAPTPSMGPTCALSPTSVQPASGGSAASTLTIGTTPASAASQSPLNALLLPFSGLALAGLGLASKKRRRLGLLLFVVFAGFAFQAGCGGSSTTGGGNPGTPSGPYTITVTATSGSTTHTAAVTLTVQ